MEQDAVVDKVDEITGMKESTLMTLMAMMHVRT